jgi:hypothetical protein
MRGELAFLLPGMSAGDFDFFSQLGIAEQRGPSQRRVRNRDERSGAPDSSGSRPLGQRGHKQSTLSSNTLEVFNRALCAQLAVIDTDPHASRPANGFSNSGSVVSVGK